ncbi:MAG: molecular chaperone TorD family protein [Desulfobacterales bacterium]|nr:molecular chaperone TorD family protein [Desulfobacterales bacterium]
MSPKDSIKDNKVSEPAAMEKGHDPAPGECPLTPGCIAGLRDFFAAVDAAALQAAYAATNNFPLDKVDWQQVEYDFNRLFVGPAAPAAPPYASVYLDENADLMGKSTLGIRQLYNSLGMQVPDPGALPDDFISYELDALLVILGQQPLDMKALKSLVSRHMGAWVPAFCERCRQADRVPQPVRHMVDLLESLVHTLSQSITNPVPDSNSKGDR